MQRQGWYEGGTVALVMGAIGVVVALAVAVSNTEGTIYYVLLVSGAIITAGLYKMRPKLFEAIAVGLLAITGSVVTIVGKTYGDDPALFAFFATGGACLGFLGWHMRVVADRYPRT